jgi:hypothetical protein
MANRIDQLTQIANQVPALNQRAAAKGKDVRTALLQQQLGGTPAPNVQAIQAQQAQLAGQQQVEQLQQAQQATAQIGQQAVQEEARVGEAAAARRAMSQEEQQQQTKNQMAARLQEQDIASKKRQTTADIQTAKKLQAAGFDVDSRLQMATEKQRNDLAKLGNGIKEELLDSRLAFEKDEIGRKFSNDRQFADYIAANAKTQQEFEVKMQEMAQVAKNEEVMMNAIRDRLLTIQQQGFVEREGDLDAQANMEIAKLANEAQSKAQKAQSKSANKLAMGQAFGTLLGIGAVALAAPTGGASLAAYGAAAAGGGALGAAAASNT